MTWLKSRLQNIKSYFAADKIGFISKFVCYALLFVLLFTMPIFTSRAGYNTISNVLSIVFCTACFIYIFLRGRFRLDWFIIPFILFCVYSLISYALTRYEFSTARRIILLYALCFFIYEFVLNTASFRFAAISFVLGAFLLAGLILVENFDALLSLDFGRLGGSFGNENAVGQIFMFAILFLGYFSLIEKKHAISNLILILFLLGFVFLTGSRGALLLSITILLVTAFLAFKGKKKIVFFAFLVVLILFLVLLLQLPSFESLKSRLSNVLVSVFTGGEGDSDANGRFFMIQEGLYLWLQAPLFGHGIGAFRYITNFDVYAHASIADSLCNFGLFGFGIWFIPAFYMLFICRNKCWALAVVFLVGFLLPGLFILIFPDSKFTNIAYVLCLANASANCDRKIFSAELSFRKRFSLKFSFSDQTAIRFGELRR